MATRFLLSLALLGPLGSGCHNGPDEAASTPTPAVDSDQASLDGPKWTLVELDGKPVQPSAANRLPHLRFDAKAGRVGGFAGCNQLGGSYEAAPSEGSLKFGALITTKMACEPGMELETQFLAMLGATQAYRLGNGTLELLMEGRPRAKFEARE